LITRILYVDRVRRQSYQTLIMYRKIRHLRIGDFDTKVTTFNALAIGYHFFSAMGTMLDRHLYQAVGVGCLEGKSAKGSTVRAVKVRREREKFELVIFRKCAGRASSLAVIVDLRDGLTLFQRNSLAGDEDGGGSQEDGRVMHF